MDLWVMAELALVVGIAGLTYRYIEVPGQACARWLVRHKGTLRTLGSSG